MKIKVTEIECSAEELRQSNTAAEGFLNLFRNAFNGPLYSSFEDSSESEEKQDDSGSTG